MIGRHNLVFTLAAAAAVVLDLAEGHYDYFRAQDLDLVSHYWSNSDNSSFGLMANGVGCTYGCGEIFYSEPPPDAFLIPPPPMHPGLIEEALELTSNVEKRHQSSSHCNLCSSFFQDSEQLLHQDGLRQSINNRFVAMVIGFLTISIVVFLYLFSTRRSKIVKSLAQTRIFKAGHQTNSNHHPLDKNSSLNESIANSGVHLSDPCYIQSNRDKNLTSPIISDHVSHKKTAIPSKYWAQPGSVIGRTVRRIPNEYEVPSSQTNSTGTSSAVYADMNNESNQRFFSPYNLHTYAEVREIHDPNEHFHTSSNSSAKLSDTNYDNAVYPNGTGCVLNNGGMVAPARNGSVQMSDFNSVRRVQSTATSAYGQQPATMNYMHHQTQSNIHHASQPMYEQPPQRAQIIITSNNQGVNPSLLNHKGGLHNVI